jgi:hypothetical protein
LLLFWVLVDLVRVRYWGSGKNDTPNICIFNTYQWFMQEKQKGGPLSFEFVFFDTHATKETKKRLRDKEISINDLDQLEFATQRSKESFVS